MPIESPDCGLGVLSTILVNLPALVAAIAAAAVAWSLRSPLDHTMRRADQLYNGEYARGVTEGHRAERARPDIGSEL